MERGLCGCYGTVLYGASANADIDIDMRWVGGGVAFVRPLVIRRGSANSSRTTIRTVRSACVLHMAFLNFGGMPMLFIL